MPADYSVPGTASVVLGTVGHMLSRTGAIRHIVGIPLTLLLTFLAHFPLGWGATRSWAAIQRLADADIAGTVALLVGVVLLALAVASGALSSAGPLLSGIVFGLIPLLWSIVDVRTLYEVLDLLPRIGGTPLHFSFAQPIVFAILFATLSGAGLATAVARRSGRRAAVAPGHG